MYLSIEDGPNIYKVPFLVVKNVSPSLILGMRSLKSLGVDIFTTKVVVMCCGVEIPLIPLH